MPAATDPIGLDIIKNTHTHTIRLWNVRGSARTINCFCKHQEDILVITLWLANGGCGLFCRIRSEAVYVEAEII